MAAQIPRMRELQPVDWQFQNIKHPSGMAQLVRLYQRLPDNAKDWVWNKVKGWGEALMNDGAESAASQDETGRGVYLGQNEADVAPQTLDYADSMNEADANAEQATLANSGSSTSATGGDPAQRAFKKALEEAKQKFEGA